ncbi:outer membrane protein assembly factor BamB family protein [Chryseolinea lacunae]|uniref:PQQ-binding-like beta-propeller repeat protein n=1 Tax=Chryseolinea lacunae TaxID=2801331 RepID=A0ABS1KX33_9BACT|nr:PQQ-binding-like beta-propeller repeat protein [Chryseolinea lacunae]MBL0744026.1 PQQ-binding-like beta-propeller repeat protein [Chryseolinea lacunae]
MFLFDRERTGRLPFELGQRAFPELVWETTLRQYPVKGPESTAVFDDQGNLYFGCHDNGIYSLDPSGKIRWQFQTEDKVYSSPMLLNNRIYICANKSDVLCLRLDGTLDWVFHGFKQLASLSKMKRVLANVYSYWCYDYEFRKYMKINAWGSPNQVRKDTIVVNLYGLGVVALDATSGALKWRRDLGLPYNHLAGVAVSNVAGQDHIAAVSQSNGIFWLDEQGKIVWRRALKRGYNSWGNPSIDAADNAIYCSTSKGNVSAIVYKFSFAGALLWKHEMAAGIRGSIAVSHTDFVVVPTMRGELLFLDKKQGRVQVRKDIATKDRGLWTSVSMDLHDTLLVNTKASQHSGAMLRISRSGDVQWKVEYGKALAVPVLDKEGHIFTATWEGKYLKYKS